MSKPKNSPKRAWLQDSDYRTYNPELFDPIPLHRPSDKRTIIRKGVTVIKQLGKVPLHPAWTTKRYSPAKVVANCIEQQRNMGIRLRPGQLVIDVDPRNGGEEGFAELAAAVGCDFRPEDFPTVRTGSGGLHVYMSAPEGLDVAETFEGYPGCEFKAVGRQVLAAGCVHPVTGKRYVFVPGRSINDLPPAPKKLLRLIKRAPRPEGAATGDGGHIANHRLARALAGLDPCDFGGKGNHARWLRLMMACHHATGGNGRQEFIAWCETDPDYANHGEEVGRRWDSLHTERADKIVTVKSLNRFLVDVGRRDLTLPTESAVEVFAADPIPFKDEMPIPEETLRYLAEQFPDDVRA